jgi:hypothetical protein
VSLSHWFRITHQLVPILGIETRSLRAGHTKKMGTLLSGERAHVCLLGTTSRVFSHPLNHIE